MLGKAVENQPVGGEGLEEVRAVASPENVSITGASAARFEPGASAAKVVTPPAATRNKRKEMVCFASGMVAKKT